MNKIKFRNQCGGLEESMKTVQEFDTEDQLKTYLEKYHHAVIKKIKFKHQVYDHRIGWDSYYVSVYIQWFLGHWHWQCVGISNGKFY
ncbi:hypothetical protein JM79_3215 [Gramella sp. Hel_I_59]|uniref:hypothetical protein n=1 Tax=Gramella sp. Hel_I_59 TaxID=1249978 RepID=UPI001151F6B2|nr:hypothetical protein [Gramella sp. Hel_I_59]TQI72258.1 hypothetical protein JM79_3215 [Gramella sp. Hel_I_59]